MRRSCGKEIFWSRTLRIENLAASELHDSTQGRFSCQERRRIRIPFRRWISQVGRKRSGIPNIHLSSGAPGRQWSARTMRWNLAKPVKICCGTAVRQRLTVRTSLHEVRSTTMFFKEKRADLIQQNNSQTHDTEARHDFWSTFENYIYGHHVLAMVKHYVPNGGPCPCPLKSFDVVRWTKNGKGCAAGKSKRRLSER